MNATSVSCASDDSRPLAGFTVVDFTRVLAGPYCTRLMADLGATVIKIERPGEGDETRPIGLQFDPARTDQSAYFTRMNAGKLGIAIDFSHPRSRALVHDLVRRADVAIENFSPGVMAKYGFDSASLRAIKPELVYCSISGFGQTGRLRSKQAYAHLINAFSGMMDLERGGELPPRASNLQAADVLAGAHAFGSILAALLRRLRTAQGATLDVSMLECMIFADDISYPVLLNGAEIHRRPRPAMMVHPIGAGHLAMQIGGVPSMWTNLTRLMGQPELADDPRFASLGARRENWPVLRQIIGEWLDTFDSVDTAAQALSQARVPNMPMLEAEQVIAHPHLADRGAFVTITHPVRGPVTVSASPYQLDGEVVGPRAPAPYFIGQHTRAILSTRLGYSDQRIDELLAEKVIAQA